LLAELTFQELPSGIVNVVTGYGQEVGEPLVVHRDTRVIAFTGSVATGKRIAQLAAEQVKKVNLELGGNDPFIICDAAQKLARKEVSRKGVLAPEACFEPKSFFAELAQRGIIIAPDGYP
jgi:acyl-CoA reductase-like NAD-dependent aldehyde dehydrogenase